MKKINSIVIAVVCIVVIIIALRFNNDQNQGDLKIGIVLPLTGAASDQAEYTKRGIDIALAELKESDNFNPKIYVEDSKYNPQEAVSSVKKLAELQKIKYIIGPHSSSEVLAVAPIIKSNSALMILAGAQTEEISHLGDYVFRLIHNTAQEAPVFAEYLGKNSQVQDMDFLSLNNPVSDAYMKYFPPVYTSYGKTIGIVEKFDTTATDFRATLSKFKNSKNKGLFVLASPKQGAIIFRQIKELGLEKELYMIGVESKELIDTANAEGVLYAYSYDASSNDEALQKFRAVYKAKYNNEEPGTLASNGYDAVILLHSCLKKVGDNVVEVKICLHQTKNYHGAGGTFDIDQNGDAVKKIIIKRIQNQEFVKVE